MHYYISLNGMLCTLPQICGWKIFENSVLELSQSRMSLFFPTHTKKWKKDCLLLIIQVHHKLLRSKNRMVILRNFSQKFWKFYFFGVRLSFSHQNSQRAIVWEQNMVGVIARDWKRTITLVWSCLWISDACFS